MKRAVLIGVNKYADSRSNLRGCVNDVRAMRGTLLRLYGFKKKDIACLLDKRATYNNIVLAINQMMDSAKAGDILVFHFSGHGSQVRDRNGDEINDHLDEIICPYDMNWSRPLTDDVLGAAFSKLPKGANLYLFFDCCHSGSMDRSMDLSRYLESPEQLDRKMPVKKVGLKNALRKGKKVKVPAQRHVMISGCRDNQTSADAYIGTAYRGAFTWHFLRALKQKHSVTKVYRQTVKGLKRDRFTQRPQIWGPKRLLKRPFFTV